MEGYHEEFHENGDLKEKGKYKKGQKDGLWVETLTNLKTNTIEYSYRSNYKNGKAHGVNESYRKERGKRKTKWKEGKQVFLGRTHLIIWTVIISVVIPVFFTR